ncbi:MAG: PQQ-binding-like beta-propeller repeat protein, partial [bacterium]
GGMRTLIVGDITASPTDGRTIKMSIIQNGLAVASAYNGPTDAAVTNPDVQTINGMVASQITNTGADAASPNSGAINVLAMDFTIPTNGGAADTLTGIRLKNTGTAVNGTDIAAVKIWAESGATAGFQSAQDTLLGSLTWNATSSAWEIFTISTVYSAALRIYATVDIAANPTDGATVKLQIASGSNNSTAGIVVASDNDGPVDSAVTNANSQTIDGMIAAQITNTGAPAATFYANDVNGLVMNFIVPANGATADTLTGLRVQNAGTLPSGDIGAVKFWEDADGDGAFEPTTHDAPALGTAVWNAGGWWEITGLSQAMPVGGKRIFVSADIAANPTVTGTIKMRIKMGATDAAAGVVVASGNDGPLDAVVTNSPVQTVNRKLMVTGVSKAPMTVEAGSVNNTIEQLQLVASQGTVTTTTLTVFLTGSAQTSDILAVKLWHDVNNNGSWDAGDTQLSTTKTFASGQLDFTLINFNTVAGTPESVIITYDIAAAPVLGRDAGFSAQARFYVVNLPTQNDVIFSSDPMNSSLSLIGRTLFVTGADKAPVGVDKGMSYVMEQLTLSASSGSINVTAITTKLTGTNVAADISSAKLYHDVNDNGTYESGTDVLLDTKTFAGSPASLTFTPALTVAAGTDENLLIYYTVAVGGTSGNTVGAGLIDSTYITTGSTENKAFLNTIQSTNSAISPSLLVAGTDKAPATVGSGQSNIVMLSIKLDSTSGTATATSIKVDLTGTAPGTAIASAKLYTDVNGNGAYEVTDTLLSTKTFAAGTLTFNALSIPVDFGTSKYLLVVYNIASGATPGVTAGAKIGGATYLTVNAPSVVAPFTTIQSTNSLISNTLQIIGTDSAALLTNNVTKGQNNALFEKIAFRMTYGSLSLTALKVDKLGTAADAEIAGAKLYRDQNSNGNFDPAIDVQLGATKTFSGGVLTFDGFSQPVVNTSTATLFIVYNISGTATQGHTAGAKITDTSYFTIAPTTGIYVNMETAPIQSTIVPIMNPIALSSSFSPLVTPVGTNQSIAVKMTVTNAVGSSLATVVAPSPAALNKTYTGGASVTLFSGPTPATASIPGGGTQDFDYIFIAAAAGTVQFNAPAKGTDVNLAASFYSATATTNIVTINASISPTWTFSDSGTTLAFYGSGAPATNPSGVKALFIGNENKKLYSINMANGTKLWSYTALAAIRGTPYVRDYVIYFGDENGNLYAVRDNGASYTELWKVTPVATAAIRTGIIRWLSGTEGRLYFGALDNRVYCRNSSNGAICTGWTNPNLGSAVYSTPALPGDGYVYVGTYGGAIIKIDRNTGTVVTNYTGYTRITAPPFVYPKNPALPANGSWLWIGAHNNNIYKIDTTKAVGAEKTWTFGPTNPVPAGIVTNSVFVDVWRGGAWGSNTVYEANNNGCLYAITDAGVQKWKYPSGADTLSNPISSCPLLDPGTNKIYFGAEDNRLYALMDHDTAPTMIPGWPYQTAGVVKSCPSMFGTLVMFPSTDGKVYAFPR